MVAVIGVVGLALEARIVAGAHTRAVCIGDGRTLAASLACAVAEGCRGLMSFGLAGGLSPDLRTGTCVVGSTIISETAQLMTDSDWTRSLLQVLPGAVHGAIVGVSSRIVAHPDAKRALRARTGALAVDNESHVVASAAAARGLPMAAVRVIMDPVTRELPASALAAVRANGTIDLAAVIRSLAKEPSDLPMLLRTTLDALIGFAALFRSVNCLVQPWGYPPCQYPRQSERQAWKVRARRLRFERIIPGALMTIDIAELFARRERERDAPPRQNPPEPNFNLIPSGPVQMQICSHL